VAATVGDFAPVRDRRAAEPVASVRAADDGGRHGLGGGHRVRSLTVPAPAARRCPLPACGDRPWNGHRAELF